MRKLLTLALILVTASLGAPVGAFAQSTGTVQLATISGESVDAGGRALVGQRVELVLAGDVVQSTTTGSRGEWSFANVTPNDYVVRMVVNGKVAGVHVLAMSGQIARALIVAPSAAAAAPIFGLAFIPSLLLVGGITAAIIATAIVVTGS